MNGLIVTAIHLMTNHNILTDMWFLACCVDIICITIHPDVSVRSAVESAHDFWVLTIITQCDKHICSPLRECMNYISSNTFDDKSQHSHRYVKFLVCCVDIICITIHPDVCVRSAVESAHCFDMRK